MTRIPQSRRWQHDIEDYFYIGNHEYPASYTAVMETDITGDIEVVSCKLYAWGEHRCGRDSLVALVGEKEVKRQEGIIEVFADYEDRYTQ